MKHLGNGEKGVADLMVNNTIVSDRTGKTEALNAQFTSVFTRENKPYISMGTSNIQDILEIVIHEAGVLTQP